MAIVVGPQGISGPFPATHSNAPQQNAPIEPIDRDLPYDMGDNGNYNSGSEAIARYPRMAFEIGGNDPEAYGNDRIQLEHDSYLIHKR